MGVETFAGTSRSFAVPPCRLTKEDLRRLYQLLSKKAKEASGLQLPHLVSKESEQIKESRKVVDEAMRVVAQIHGTNGDWVGGTSPDVLSDESLPETIARVQFDSALLFRLQFGNAPMNSISVNLDFGRTSIFDSSPEPSQNQSIVQVSGNNQTWVNGVFEELRTFFGEKQIPRSWLHAPRAYDAFLLVAGFPLAFILVFRIDQAIRSRLSMPESLFFTFYIFLVLIILWAFRTCFNYARWVFPKLEGPDRREKGPILHKALLIIIGGTLLSIAIEAVLPFIGIRVF